MTDYVNEVMALVDMIGFSAVNTRNNEPCKIYGIQVFEDTEPIVLVRYTSETSILKEDWISADALELPGAELYDGVLEVND